MELSDYELFKKCVPKIPKGKDTRKHIMLGWAALVLFPVWLPVLLGYIFLWALSLIGQATQEFLTRGITWLGESAAEKG